ncbi:hypothetical protein KFL_000260510 [Klebsormidium nitens]|uniref:Alpha/beta-Hydrolases superfamily protein n=1 Tax=Klebsormidium nitens TaxID=105231 RepID=A0A1Y1HKU8_KLENI|nr:hypothetical protein KFL_000260510 [Klebsormidium nitens]|eukprot:GAQ79234.1 hypothetical protein KFL_000260510 [Klebsormidium nitens]
MVASCISAQAVAAPSFLVRMVSGVGGADWFEVASRLAQAETNIGLGRIVDSPRSANTPRAGQERGEEKGNNKQVTFQPTFTSDKKERIATPENTKSRGAVFGPPSPPLKRHAAPLFKVGKLADAQSNRKHKQEQFPVELEDVTSDKQSFDSKEGQDKERPAEADGALGGEEDWELIDGEKGTGAFQEDEERPAEKQITPKSVRTAKGLLELPDLVGTSPPDQEASLLRDWSLPSPSRRTVQPPLDAGKSPRTASASTKTQAPVDRQTNTREDHPQKEEDGHSIWQFNEFGRHDHAQELERRGSLQMEELVGPLRGGTPEGGPTPSPRESQLVPVSPFGALANVPGWNLAQAGLLSTSLGQRVASFVGEVVAASAEHEQRFVGRLRSNSFKKNGVPSELKAMDTASGSGPDSRADSGAELASSGGEGRALPEAALASVETGAAEAVLERGPAAEMSNADWMSRIQSATTQQLGEWLARVKMTYRGSKEDIGWLKREPGMPPITDGSERFLQLLGQIVHGIHSLSDEYVYLLTPGLFSNFGPLYLYDTKKYLAKLGLSTHIAKIHSEAAVEKNALEICQYVEELNWGTGKQVVILGHSKGGIDACAALALFPERLAGKVRGIALVQSPYAGNPVCSDILREGQVADFGSRAVLQTLMHHALKGELRALEDLTYEHRRAFILSHPLPPGIPLVSFHTEASRAPTALSTITTVGHAELPLAALVAGATSSAAAQSAGVGKLPIAMPIGATLATIAGHLELRYGEKSDGLVTRPDAEVPGSVVVRPEKKLDHAWPVFGGGKSTPGEPEPAHVNEALLTLLLESQFPPGQAPVVRQVRSGDPPKRWR